MDVVIGGFVLASIGAVVWSVRSQRRDTMARWAIWERVAQDWGGSFEPGSKWRMDSGRIEAGGVAVDLRSTGGKHPTYYTRWSASSLKVYFPEFHIYPEGVLASLGKRLGFQDCVLGVNAQFDDHFVVKTPDPPAARAVWTGARQSQLMAFAAATIESRRGEVTLEVLGITLEPAVLNAGIEFVSRIMAVDFAGGAALSELSSVSGSETGRPFTEVNVPSRVRLATEEHEGVLCSVARSYERRDMVDMSAAVRGDRLTGEDTGRLPPAVQQSLVALGDGTLTVQDGYARFRWTTVQTKPDVLRAGASLVSMLGRTSDGAYR